MLREAPKTLIYGFLMGTADLVPGVSGGTIALVLGIYERLVASIKAASSALGRLARADPRGFRNNVRQVEWAFLIPLLLGIVTAVFVLADVIEHLLETKPTLVAAVFLGLVAGSVVVAWRRVVRPTIGVWAVGLLVAILTFLLLGARAGGPPSASPALVVFFLSGALAICAMILPGISGSLILVLVGMYDQVLGTVTQRRLLSLGVFLMGAVVGLALFSQVLHWALRNHHDVVLGGLVGLMAGSARVLWPWPDGVASGELAGPGPDWGLALIGAVVGLLLVVLLSALAERQPAASATGAGLEASHPR